jgi:hypothetical protein
MPNVTKRNKLFSFDLLEKRALEVWNGYIDAFNTVDPASLAAGASGSPSTFSVPGARLGDFVVASFSLPTTGLQILASVSANDTVAVAFVNPTAGIIDLAPGVVNVRVFKRVPL